MIGRDVCYSAECSWCSSNSLASLLFSTKAETLKEEVVAVVEAFYSLSSRSTRFVRDGHEIMRIYDEDIPDHYESYGQFIRTQKRFIENAHDQLRLLGGSNGD